ncbi:aminotransferase class IV [Acetobacter sp.]|jgi:branched-chain amino acid aminotransferase|uniref:aminotransferase class IV n=1 Tax=Acetobacter sp. TaxID=440 RepID=UPI0025BCC530|nr:aminotransferase class IV [Acetobacter sp.]MCH4091720.1 aminotransferase class IV [Acetobacter sp.]MCI1300423.1 aminotransferase class IV [Acetobacter sp.]MCI1316758.1 aminotransferase class IV [Acetobacter sp.]
MTALLWLNGALLPANEARIDPADRGLLLGDGLFETMRVATGCVPLLERHLDRLGAGCATLFLPPPDRERLRRAVGDLLAASGLVEGSMRLTVTRGCGPRGLRPPAQVQPTVMLTCAAGVSAMPAPVRLGVSRYVRDGSSPLSRVKSLNYLPMVMARMEAAAGGHDDALLLDGKGNVAEASAANILLMLAGRVVTPPVEDGALPGTSRARLLETGLCVEQSVPLACMREAQAAWLVSALSLQPVASVEAYGHMYELEQCVEQEAVLREALFGNVVS